MLAEIVEARILLQHGIEVREGDVALVFLRHRRRGISRGKERVASLRGTVERPFPESLVHRSSGRLS